MKAAGLWIAGLYLALVALAAFAPDLLATHDPL